MSTLAPTGVSFTADQTFFTRLAIGISLFIIFAFAQFSLRGMVRFEAVPWWTHLHAFAMLSWLALWIAQNHLAGRGNLRLHARLGWTGMVLAMGIGALGIYTGQMAITLGRVPPFFSDPFFLALTAVEATAFTAVVLTAIAMRRQTEWHRRLILVSAVIILEPALGRLSPLPFMGVWVYWTVLVLQLMVLGIAMRHDQKVHGRVHAALWVGALALVSCTPCFNPLHSQIGLQQSLPS